MGYSSLARVQSGWTGTIVLTDSANVITITITPYTRESVASLIARLVHERTVRGLTLAVSVDSLGVITLDAGAWDTFDIVFTGNVATRTGFTGTYTGLTTFVADDPIENAIVYDNGMRLESPLVATSRAGVVSDGTGAGSPNRISGSSTLTIWPSSMTTPDFGHDFDLWHDGRIQGRFAVRGAPVRRPLSRTLRSATTTRLDLDVEEVT